MASLAAATLVLGACSSETPIPAEQGGSTSGGAPGATGGMTTPATGGNATGGVTTQPTGGSISAGGQSLGGTAPMGGGGGAGTNTTAAGSPQSQGGSNGGTASAGMTSTSGGGAAGTSGGAAGGGPSGGAGANAGGSNGGNGSHTGGAAGSSATGGSTAGAAGAGGGTTRPARALLYSFSTLNIPSVPAQLTLLKQKLESLQYQVDQSKEPSVFTDANLAKYGVVGMINTCFSPFGENKSGTAEAQALKKFVQEGGGLFGTHCADVTFQSANPPHVYNQLIGGRASSENFDGNSDCSKMGDHPTITRLPETFRYTGNLDATDYIAPDTTVLVKCTWGNTSKKEVNVSWVRSEGAGRVFYTNFGKVDADLSNATFGENHILAGLAWVIGR